MIGGASCLVSNHLFLHQVVVDVMSEMSEMSVSGDSGDVYRSLYVHVSYVLFMKLLKITGPGVNIAFGNE